MNGNDRLQLRRDTMTATVAFFTKNPASRRMVEGVRTPARTATYEPVSYAQFLGLMEDRLSGAGFSVTSQRYGLSAEGQQLFGAWTLDVGNNEGGLVCGFRASHNKTLPLGIIIGMSIFVCDNLCFSGSHDQVVRKHTLNVIVDLERKIDLAIGNARPAFARTATQMRGMKGVPMDDRAFYRLLGDLLRTGAINRNLMGLAIKMWKNPPHVEFQGRNLYCAYNAINEAYKRSQARDMTHRHVGLHREALAWAAEHGVILTGGNPPVGSA